MNPEEASFLRGSIMDEIQVTIADYFAIGVLIVSMLWAATRLFRATKS
jgi:hypothetical protein